MSFVIHHGDALAILRTMPDESVNCCVTSPPYWGLRDYGTSKWEGGRPDCEHVQRHGLQGSTGQRADRTYTGRIPYRGKCGKCGAARVDQQIGLEETPEAYVARLVGVFAEVRRVLKSDGTCWINMGDSYASSSTYNTTNSLHTANGWKQDSARRPNVRARHGKDCDPKRGDAAPGQPFKHGDSGLKPKDMVGIPWRVAFALQSAGWWLRSDNIWCKGNCMPESVKDRPTRAHEYVFLLSKSARYFYDQGAVKEPASTDTHARYARGRSDNHKYADGGTGKQTIARSFEHMRAPGVHPKAAKPGSGIRANESFSAAVKDIVEMRNMRSWWLINSEPTPEAHFATFPLRLAERCVLAGCPAGGVVLDPFAGAGTTGLACLKNGREFIGIELNEEYIRIAEARARKYYPLLAGSAPGTTMRDIDAETKRAIEADKAEAQRIAEKVRANAE